MPSVHTRIYHLAQAELWERASRDGGSYYPPTYGDDGFVHGTSDPARLLAVANHFYRGVGGDWCCLCMTVDSLQRTGVKTVFEKAAPVGASDSDLAGAEDELFPHLYGGISAAAVLEVRPVTRAADGTFLSVAGVTG